MKIDPFELEKHIMPIEAINIFLTEFSAGVPTAIGYHEPLGWYVLQTSGQGPYVIWPELDKLEAL